MTIGILLDEPASLEQVRPYLPYGYRETSPVRVDRSYRLSRERDADGRDCFTLYCDGETRIQTDTFEEMLESGLEPDLRVAVAELAPHRIFVHAGVVGVGGAAVIIPGRSGVGKTTLVAALVRAGALYYSDEYAVLDKRGRVHPFAAPLQVREAIGLPQKKYPAEMLGGRVGAAPLPVGLVVAAAYEPGARWRPRHLSPAQGVLELLDNTLVARARPEQAMRTLEQAVAHALVLKGVRAEAEEAARDLLTMLPARAQQFEG